MSEKRSTRLTLSDRWYVLRRAVVSFWLSSGIDDGAKLTYFTVLAFAPTLLSAYSIATLILVNNKAIVNEVVGEFIDNFIIPGYETLVRDIVRMVIGTSTGGIIGLIVSVVISLISASAYVRAFARTANDAYGIAEGRNFFRVWASMALVTFCLVIGVVGIIISLSINETTVDSVVVPLAQPLGLEELATWVTSTFMPVWIWARWILIAILIPLMLDILFHFAPNIKIPKFRFLSAGSITAAVGVVLVGSLFAIYLLYFTALSSYGAIGTLLAALFALWGANIAVVFGLMVDVETERVHQLHLGEKAEEDFHLPLRSTNAVKLREKVHGKLVEEATEIRKEANASTPDLEKSSASDDEATVRDPARVSGAVSQKTSES